MAVKILKITYVLAIILAEIQSIELPKNEKSDLKWFEIMFYDK